MFVHRTHGVVAAVGALVLGACTDPTQRTDLRPDGPPEVLAVVVMNDAAANLLESATFCKTQGPNDGAQGAGDEKRPGLVGLPDFSSHQICPDDLKKGVDELADAAPQTWYARIMFDELLNPDIEELIPINDDQGNPTGTFTGSIANTHPVTLQCQGMAGGMVDVPYDGYYSPSGNNVTWPLGPSLVIKPADPTLIHTTSECQVTILENVVDKDGNKVPADQRGPYKFKVAPISVVAVSPADGDAVDPIDAGVDVTFNTFIDSTTFDDTTFTFTPMVSNVGVFDESGITGAPEYFLYGDFPAKGDFTWEMKAGAKLKDQCGFENTLTAGDVASMTKVEFTTNDVKLRSIAPFDGQMNAAPANKVIIKWNQYMDPATFDAADYTLTPTVPNLAIDATADLSGIEIYGDFSPTTDYTFTLKSGASVDDCPGGEFGACVKSATYTSTMDQVVHFKTAAIALTGTSPKDNATVAKATMASTLKMTLTFNQDMVAASLTPDEYTISGGLTLAVTNKAANVLQLATATMVPAGTYTFTLHAGATINDKLGNTYTNPSDLVIHFTVKDPAPTPPATPCL